MWKLDGTVVYQRGADGEKRRAPPWLWGVTDQTEPTMPAWMKDDEKWQAALDAQGPDKEYRMVTEGEYIESSK